MAVGDSEKHDLYRKLSGDGSWSADITGVNFLPMSARKRIAKLTGATFRLEDEDALLGVTMLTVEVEEGADDPDESLLARYYIGGAKLNHFEDEYTQFSGFLWKCELRNSHGVLKAHHESIIPVVVTLTRSLIPISSR